MENNLAQDRRWLLAQLEAWPDRIDPSRTTSIEYLMKSAAQHIRQARNEALEEAVGAAEGLVEDGPLTADWHLIDLFRRMGDAGRSTRDHARVAAEYVAEQLREQAAALRSPEPSSASPTPRGAGE